MVDRDGELTTDQLDVLCGKGKEAFVAPDEFRWVCLACGKTAQDRTGPSMEGTPRGWDASCFCNSVLAHEKDLRYNAMGYVDEILRVAHNPNGGS